MKKGSILKKLKFASIGSAMADMALLLLIFFMATTTTEPPKGVEVELPKAKTKGAEQDSLYMTISANSAIYLDGEKLALASLGDALSMRAGETDRTVSLTADKGLEYKEVKAVLEVLREHDFLNVVFMAEPREETND